VPGATNLRELTHSTYAGYVQDKWKVRNNFTLNLGVRYEYYPLIQRADRGLEVFNFATNQLDICGVAGNLPTCGITVEKLLFSPRLGWSYRLNDTTVIRAGYSRNPQNDNSATAQMPPSQSFPVTIIYTEAAANNYSAVGNLSDGVTTVPLSYACEQPAGVPQLIVPSPVPRQHPAGRAWRA